MAENKQIGFGVQTPQEGCDYETIKVHWQEAEKLGYNSAWLDDHLYAVEQSPESPQMDCYMLMSALARDTSTLRFGTLVGCNSYRPPALMAKMAASIDNISNGRFEHGYGAGWYESEYLGYGYPFPKPAVRLGQLAEAMEIYRKMQTEERASFEGKYYNIKDVLNNPKPVQKPYPPIWIGGGGEKLTLKIVAQHADYWNAGGSPADFEHKIAILNEHCANVGRNPAEITKTWFGPCLIDEDKDRVWGRAEQRATRRGISVEQFAQRVIVGTPEQVTERLNDYIEKGVSYFIFMFGRVSDLRSTRLFAEKVIPNFR